MLDCLFLMLKLVEKDLSLEGRTNYFGNMMIILIAVLIFVNLAEGFY